MTTSDTRSIRRAGIAGIVGGALTALSGAAVATYVVPATDVPDTMWSYPWSSGALVPVSIAYAVLHGLVIVGLLGFARSGVAGDGRAARLGPMIAVAGTAILLLAELLSILIADQRMDDTGPMLVGACFGVGTIVSAVGFLVAGGATVAARRWDGWRRFTPLATGIWLVAMIVLVNTAALAASVTVYGGLLVALGVALATQPAPRAVQPEQV
ncbi:MAG: hypothetical protein LH603_05000 [Pseudonocardia sp.]|nr:hypothetical protein [Pseudonocardia sp.]